MLKGWGGAGRAGSWWRLSRRGRAGQGHPNGPSHHGDRVPPLSAPTACLMSRRLQTCQGNSALTFFCKPLHFLATSSSPLHPRGPSSSPCPGPWGSRAGPTQRPSPTSPGPWRTPAPSATSRREHLCGGRISRNIPKAFRNSSEDPIPDRSPSVSRGASTPMARPQEEERAAGEEEVRRRAAEATRAHRTQEAIPSGHDPLRSPFPHFFPNIHEVPLRHPPHVSHEPPLCRPGGGRGPAGGAGAGQAGCAQAPGGTVGSPLERSVLEKGAPG